MIINVLCTDVLCTDANYGFCYVLMPSMAFVMFLCQIWLLFCVLMPSMASIMCTDANYGLCLVFCYLCHYWLVLWNMPEIWLLCYFLMSILLVLLICLLIFISCLCTHSCLYYDNILKDMSKRQTINDGTIIIRTLLQESTLFDLNILRKHPSRLQRPKP